MDQEPVRIEHSFDASPRVGKLLLTHEVLRDERPLVGALFSLLTIIHSEPHESGRGMVFVVACDKDCTAFDALEEGTEIPEYRVEFVHDGHFADPECERRRVDSGRFGFAFFRKIIVRVPPLQMVAAARNPRLH